MDQYAVIGNPIAHSKSPLIHSAFAEQTRQEIRYTKILGDTGDFGSNVRQFIDQGGRGLNVTVPFKNSAWDLVDEHLGTARLSGAVNTIIINENGLLTGANTDGIGLVRDLIQNHQITLEGQRILILGAGGATRGILTPLLEQSPARLAIANRTASRAEQLACDFANFGPVSGFGLEKLPGEQFDLVINATSASLNGELPAIPDTLLKPGATVYDLMYATEPTTFIQWGLEHGAAKALDGLGMLVEQAAESFYLWRGIRPQSQPVIKMLATHT